MTISHEFDEVVEITDIGYDDVFDIINFESNYGNVYEGEGNFSVDGLVVHNCIPEYVERRDDKKQLWKSGEHPDIAEELIDTHGIIVYQEQLQKIWQKFAGFTAPEAEKARKAVAKKWTEQLKGIEARWKAGASRTIGEQWANVMWERMVSFGRYAFNQCLSKDTILVDSITGVQHKLGELHQFPNDLYLLSLSLDGEFIDDKVEEIINTGMQDVVEIELSNGAKQTVTMNHRFMCDDGDYRTIEEIIRNDHSIMVRSDDTKCTCQKSRQSDY